MKWKTKICEKQKIFFKDPNMGLLKMKNTISEMKNPLDGTSASGKME